MQVEPFHAGLLSPHANLEWLCSLQRFQITKHDAACCFTAHEVRLLQHTPCCSACRNSTRVLRRRWMEGMPAASLAAVGCFILQLVCSMQGNNWQELQRHLSCQGPCIPTTEKLVNIDRLIYETGGQGTLLALKCMKCEIWESIMSFESDCGPNCNVESTAGCPLVIYEGGSETHYDKTTHMRFVARCTL